MVDSTRTFEVENGVSVTGGCSVLSGPDSPHSIAVESPSFYQRTNGELWFNAGSFWIPLGVRNLVSQYQKVTYDGNDNVTSIEFFSSPLMTEATRISRYEPTYSGDNISSEDLIVYNTNGTSVLTTATSTYTYTGDNVTNVEVTFS